MSRIVNNKYFGSVKEDTEIYLAFELYELKDPMGNET